MTQMSQKTKGILCIVTAAFCFAVMNVFVRLAGDLPSVQKSFFRNLVAMFFAALILLKDRRHEDLDRGKVGWLVLRSLFGTASLLCNYYAVDHLVMADAAMLNKIGPFFAILMSFFLLREKVSLFQGAAVAVAFCGSLLIVKPTGFNLETFPAIIGFLGGAFSGIAYTMVRVLGKKGVRGPFIIFFFSSFSCAVTLPALLLGYRHMTWVQLGTLMLAGLSAAGAQFAVTAAYRYAPAKELSVYDYSQVLFSAILGFIIFGQTPDLLSGLGYVVIFGTAVAMFFHESTPGGAPREKSPSQNPPAK